MFSGRTTRVHPELPIFCLHEDDRVVLYTPGAPIEASVGVARAVEAAFLGTRPADAYVQQLADVLEMRGRAAWVAWNESALQPFEPECLTLYLSNQCNLACVYCYAVPDPAARTRRRVQNPTEAVPLLSDSVVTAAARLVARNCAAKCKPLTLVLHGGGEPTLHWNLLIRVWNRVASIGRAHGVELWSYIATHGVIAESRARWLARHFNLVGLSCDGPPSVQDANRPTGTGAATAGILERTARILRDEGASLVVRCTITPNSMRRQSEIVAYLCDRLFAGTIRLEPAYDGRSADRRFFVPDDADEFVSHYLEAYRVAQEHRCELELSGVRIDELHGPYCNPSRAVLQLTPDGTASACFLSVGNDGALDGMMTLGRLDPSTGELLVDHARAAAQRRQSAAVPARCQDCHNIYHCARDCPDTCLLSDSEPSWRPEGFRCRVQKLIGRHQILQRATTYR